MRPTVLALADVLVFPTLAIAVQVIGLDEGV